MGKKEDKKIAAKPVKKVESESESSSEEEKPVVKAAPVKGKVVAKKQESSSEESSSEEEKPVVKKPVTKGKPAPKKESSSEEESSEEESEAEAPAPKKAAPAAKKAASESESESGSESEEEQEEEEKPQKRKADTNAQDAKRKKGSSEEARIFVGGLPWSANDETLLEFVNSLDIGTFTEANVITERDTGRSKGFGYVTTTSDVAEALMKITDAEMDGRTLRFDNSDKKDAKPAARAAFGGGQTSAPATTLMVRNLSYNVDNDTLQQTFENATSCRVAMDRESGSSRGFGFVEFSSVDEAKAALESFNGTELDGRSISIDFAAPKPEGGRGGFGGDRGGRGGFRGRGGFGGDRGGFRGGRGGDRGGRGGRGRGGFSDRGRGGFQGNKQKFDD